MAKHDDDLDAVEDDFQDYLEDPKPRTSFLTVLLCVLNVAAAVGFAYLLVLDYHKRQAWSYAVFMHDLKIAGLPLEEEKEGFSASRAMFPTQRLHPGRLKDVYNRRGGKPVTESFQDLEETLRFVITPDHLRDRPELLKDYFSGIGESDKPGEDAADLEKVRKPVVITLEDEVKRLIKDVPDDIATAAKEFAAAAKDKRGTLTAILLPLSMNVEQVELLVKRIKEAPDGKLEAMLADAAQRRMYLEILNPLEIYRPIDFELPSVDKKEDAKNIKARPVDKYDIDNIADIDRFTIADAQDLFKRRLEDLGLAEKHDPKLHLGDDFKDMKRDTIEKRQAIAFLLTAVYHVRKPNDQLLYKFGPDRAMAIVGVWEYAFVYQMFADTHIPVRERFVNAIRTDRDGRPYEYDGKSIAMHGFQADYRDKIARIHRLMDEIWQEEKRLKAYDGMVMGLEQVVKDREVQVKKSTDDLLNERKESSRLALELRRLQHDLLEAQKHLSNAIADNLRLNDDLREVQGLPRLYSPKKK
jgi:hypothetical protein